MREELERVIADAVHVVIVEYPDGSSLSRGLDDDTVRAIAKAVLKWLRGYETTAADALARITELEAALRKINALIDSPARYNADVQAVLDSVIDTSDVKFTAP